MKSKSFSLFRGTEQGKSWSVIIEVKENETITRKSSFQFHSTYKRTKQSIEKYKIRNQDKTWVMHHIPSSIWWFTEIHHDWEDGGRMYLLTKAEHILRHRTP